MEPIAAQDFVCNLCGARNTSVLNPEDREARTCSDCQSSIRLRSVVLALTRELFGHDAPLTSLPVVKSIRGMGVSDSTICASVLEKVFDYQNTYYHKEPRFDLLNPDPERFGKYDFVVCSEVLEHVPPPADVAFRSLAQLLKPGGVLILTVPYFPGTATLEHFPALRDFGFATVNGKTVLVNRTDEGKYEVFDDLCFHGGEGATLEMRIFTESDLKRALVGAGLGTVRVHADGNAEYGVVFGGPCSLPMSARSGPFSLNAAAISEIIGPYIEIDHNMRHVKYLHSANADLVSRLDSLGHEAESLRADLVSRTEWARSLDAERNNLADRYNKVARSWWVRVGRRLGLVPRS